MPAFVNASGTWRPVTVPRARVAGSWLPIRNIYARVAGVWQLVFTALTATILGGETQTRSTANFNFNTNTCTPNGGTAPYNYLWSWSDQTGATWTFNAGNTSVTVTPRVTDAIVAEPVTANLTCQVTDANGIVVLTNTSAYSYTRF